MDVVIPRGFKIGHAETGNTGLTVILCEKGAVGGCDIRGGAPGTRETDLMRPEKMMDRINAVVLSGGSAYGLGAMSGVMEYLKEQGAGYRTSGKIVPIVTGAVIFDLNGSDYEYPTAQTAVEACKNATRTPEFGNIGVGKGATVGKIRGIRHSSRGGVGAATVKVAGVTMTAIVAVNAMGDVIHPDTREILAGAKNAKGGFIDTEKCMLDGEYAKLLLGTNTTIGCLITDAGIDKVQANKLAGIAHNGFARAIRPVHTDYDGDSMFCLSAGSRPVLNFALLQVAAVKATELAIIDAVRAR